MEQSVLEVVIPIISRKVEMLANNTIFTKANNKFTKIHLSYMIAPLHYFNQRESKKFISPKFQDRVWSTAYFRRIRERSTS